MDIEKINNSFMFDFNYAKCDIITILFGKLASQYAETVRRKFKSSDLTFQARTKKKLTRRNPDETKKSSYFFMSIAKSFFLPLLLILFYYTLLNEIYLTIFSLNSNFQTSKNSKSKL
ncbi:hypothetical protein BpHYR1_000601 [Brachionus plicatilis]|uniref:Uncharacterized protein n=1 Tax=Brachionus plicatilis TaxID=10195 RepID=A0A3M7R5S7_BRAPC|nr:hypothetical protein BpHYR1_000601 [Brachionus plicatilis]